MSVKYFFKCAPVGTKIGGGDGGGKVVNGVWCHEEIIAINMQRAVADVIEGKTERLAVPSLEKLEEDAGAGDANAQYYLGKRLRKDSPQASIEWFRKAGVQKILGAMHSLFAFTQYRQGRTRILDASPFGVDFGR